MMDDTATVDLHLLLTQKEFELLTASVTDSIKSTEKYLDLLALVRDKARTEIYAQRAEAQVLEKLAEKLNNAH